MSGIKVGDKVACFIEDKMVVCTVTVVEGACCTVMDGLGQKRNRTIARCLTVDQLISLAEEIVGVQKLGPEKRYVKVTAPYDETGAEYLEVGDVVEVISGNPDAPLGAVEVRCFRGGGLTYALACEWYTTEI
ncbi:MAG: hypothetical protein Unbinned5081contig1000_39 [Prokaryotic dsDNA virus sp.]|nr:MAG: hypothetical protein Unbinned5081contig1000_39 [Prokaryotic dsDNA virus sp.]|tara:strand:- start:11595 stop:11990 length:396 start_codon:yes stop_codon:yes gene_type:complete